MDMNVFINSTNPRGLAVIPLGVVGSWRSGLKIVSAHDRCPVISLGDFIVWRGLRSRLR